MNIDDEIKEQGQRKPEKAPHRISLPGWMLKEEEIGLGEGLERVFHRMGARSCPGCKMRAAALNRKFVLSRR
jgi:hypothetical protein